MFSVDLGPPDADQIVDTDVQPRLFAGFADGGGLRALTRIDRPARRAVAESSLVSTGVHAPVKPGCLPRVDDPVAIKTSSSYRH